MQTIYIILSLCYFSIRQQLLLILIPIYSTDSPLPFHPPIPPHFSIDVSRQLWQLVYVGNGVCETNRI